MPRICHRDNLCLAFWRAARGKWQRGHVRDFAYNLERNLRRMGAQLLRGDFPFGRYVSFQIWDPKQRTIHAPCFQERVAHHALMNLCEPIFDRLAIHDTFACRRGKGRLAAIRRAESFCRSRAWFLKMDVRSYFPSVDHRILLQQLERKFKDIGLVRLFQRILSSYCTGPGRGLPIGALTSQHFANFHLAALDRFIKQQLRLRAYVRYMDDFVAWSEDKQALKQAVVEIRAFLDEKLRLEFKPTPFINRTRLGMDFLGYRIFPSHTRLTRRNTRRLSHRYRGYRHRLETGDITERDYQQRVTALVAFIDGTRSRADRRRVFSETKGGV
jgi:hypothetical protein